jgi:Zn-dependent protease
MKTLFALFTALKLGKVLVTGGTMLLSVFAYAFIFGFWYAFGFVVLILVHEMGHFIAARQKGLNVGAPVFIPFVGAWINLKDLPHDAEMEAYIGLAGPLVGTIGALVCYFFARNLDSDLLLALSYAGFFLNLFNLIPLHPFDGGRVTAVLSPRIWLIGAPIMVAYFFYHPSPLVIIIVLLALPSLVKAWKYDPNAPENQQYYGVRTETKVTYGIYYLVLLLFLAVMTGEVHDMLQHLRSPAP